MVIKNQLDEIMWRRKISVKDLAEKAGIPAPRVSAIKNNPVSNITLETITKLCVALEIGVSDLLVMVEEIQGGEDRKIAPAQQAAGLHRAA